MYPKEKNILMSLKKTLKGFSWKKSLKNTDTKAMIPPVEVAGGPRKRLGPLMVRVSKPSSSRGLRYPPQHQARVITQVCMPGDGLSANNKKKFAKCLVDNRSEVNLLRKGFIEVDLV